MNRYLDGKNSALLKLWKGLNLCSPILSPWVRLFDGVMVGMAAVAVCSATATVRVWKEAKCKGIVENLGNLMFVVFDMYREGW